MRSAPSHARSLSTALGVVGAACFAGSIFLASRPDRSVAEAPTREVAVRSAALAPGSERGRPPIGTTGSADLPDRWALRGQRGLDSAAVDRPPTTTTPFERLPPETAPAAEPAGAPSTATPEAVAALQSPNPGAAPDAGVGLTRAGRLAAKFENALRDREQVQDRRLAALVESDGMETSTHFALRVPPRSGTGSMTRGMDMLRALEAALSLILRDLPTVPARHIPVLALDQAAFDARFGSSPGMTLLGVYSPSERTIYVNDALGGPAESRGRETLAHELTHALVDLTTKSRQVATWVNEGFARYQGRRSVNLAPVSDAEWASLKGLADAGKLPKLSTVRHSLGENLIAYPLGAAVCTFIERRYGINRIGRYLAALDTGKNHAASMREAFQVDEERFEVDFLEWLRGL